jgi:hypothetical protein
MHTGEREKANCWYMYITYLGDLDISFVLLDIFKISFTFRVLQTITQKAYQNK